MGVGQSVGAFGSFRQQVRMETNPMDKCTIVSAYHKDIVAEKPTIQPSRFLIPKAVGDEYTLTVIGPSSWWKEVDEHQPLLEMVCSSYQISNAIVNDFIGSLLGARGHAQKPAVFVALGEWDKKSIKDYKDKVSGKPFATLLNEAKNAQKLYYTELVRIADILWTRSNGNPLAISDDARLAAVNLGVDKNKAWMQDFKTLEMTNCKSCGFMVNPLYPICPNCKNSIEGVKPAFELPKV